MGALQFVKESKIGKIISESFGAFMDMVNLEPEEDSVEEAIKSAKYNPDDFKDLSTSEEEIKEILKEIEEGSEKDEDGYNKIPNKLEGIEAKVSEKEAQKTTGREKGGKEKTRVDED